MKRFLAAILILFLVNVGYSQTKTKVACIAFYNVENLFDTIDNPNKRDEEFTPQSDRHWNTERYKLKLDHIATVISKIGTDYVKTGPIIMGLAEVEDSRVLEDLIRQPQIADRHYRYVHFEGPDFRGIDVALLYNPLYFRLLEAHPVRVHLPNGHPTRDILYAKGILDRTDTLFIIVNHWPSRRGGERRSAPLRDTAAATARRIIDSIFRYNPDARIIVMGDLNDNPDNESVVKYLRAKGKKKQLQPGDLYNPMWKKYKNGIGTTAYQDTWSLFDQLMISQALLKDHNHYKFWRAEIYNKPFLIQKTGRFEGYPFRTYAGGEFLGGYSDHFPVYLLLIKTIQN